MSELTRILKAMQDGVTSGTDKLLPIVYNELRAIATAKLARESAGHTLQTTALVHEAYLRLLGPGSADNDDQQNAPQWQSRGHFFAAAAEAMRRILIDNARRKKQLKRGGDRQRVALDYVELAIDTSSVDLLELDEALAALEAQHEDKALIVKLRYFAGLTIEEVAAALDVSEPTVKRHWNYARAWLQRELSAE